MTPEEQLLVHIVHASAPHKSENNPYGFTHVNVDAQPGVDWLAGEGMIQAAAPRPEGIPVRPLELGMKWAQALTTPIKTEPAAKPAANPAAAPSPMAAHAATIVVEDNVPMPEAPRRGNFTGAGGPTLLDRYGFANMSVGQSFFVSQSVSTDSKKPVHRTFSSVVSNANKKLHPMNFAIREVDETAQGRGKGARVWRLQDMKGERPVRLRKVKPDAPAAAPQTPPPSGFGAFTAPGAVASPAPGAFPAPGGFPAPQGGFSPPSGGFASPFTPTAGGFGGGFPMPADDGE